MLGWRRGLELDFCFVFLGIGLLFSWIVGMGTSRVEAKIVSKFGLMVVGTMIFVSRCIVGCVR